jgi:hypothetical protein
MQTTEIANNQCSSTSNELKQPADCVVSPKTALALSRTLEVNGESFDFASDYHLPINQAVVDKVIETLVQRKQSDIFVCVGDVFDADKGEDRSEAISDFLTKLSKAYSLVLYTPGNHCLRSRDNPWESFQVPDNVLFPKGDMPLIVNTEKNKIVLANLFYDLRFIEPSSIGFAEADILKFYREKTTDGKHLLGGDITLFKSMADNVAKCITPDVTMLVSHTVPHPVAVTFRVPVKTEELRRIEAETGARVDCMPEDDAREAAAKNKTAEGFREYWNKKSFVMGSNVISHQAARPRDGLICLYGHNHRSRDFDVVTASGLAVGLRSHQPYGGDEPTAWEAIITERQAEAAIKMPRVA